MLRIVQVIELRSIFFARNHNILHHHSTFERHVMKTNRSLFAHKAFTLVELLVVIAIIGVLA